jgi:flagellar biosynthetic protein FlhB
LADQSGKTEKATEQKRRDERKKGNIFQSKDITSSVVLLASIFVLRVAASFLYHSLRDIVREGSLSVSFSGDLSPKTASLLFSNTVFSFLRLFAPVALVALVTSVVLSGVQTRFKVTGSLLRPKFSRLNPVSGITKMFSGKSLVELLKNLIKLVVIVVVVYTEISSRLSQMASLPLTDIKSAVFWTAGAAYSVMMKIAMLMVVFGVADYMYQWWSYERSIRMTKQEVKEEIKRMEGDPHIKGRIKEVQRRLAAMRMMRMVAEADVVVRNPTHYAVALRYDPQKDHAPLVVAKGKGHLALKIIREAEKHSVYITENKPLARGLYESVELNCYIPEEYYKAVAELIAYLYQIKNKMPNPAMPDREKES